MSDDRLTIGSLFSGIGGLDLGLERTGHFRTAWFCEREPYCQRVLATHWPGVPIYDDATNLPDDVERPDVITAGFPCQPVSHAGRRLAQDDERWLWPYVGRLVRLLRPRIVLLENVPGLLTAGFGDVISDLAACGYDAQWDCIPAAAVGAPHLRDRVFIVAAPSDLADATDAGQQARSGDRVGVRATTTAQPPARSCGAQADVADTDRLRMEGARPELAAAGVGRGRQTLADAAGIGRQGSGQLVHASNPAPCRQGQAVEPVNGCVSGQWEPEPNVGRVANGVSNRVDRLRALGNAVVPQVAEHVGWGIVHAFGLAR